MSDKINTEIGVDVTESSLRSVKELTRSVNQLGRETHVTEKQLRSQGDVLGATKEKYNGLSRQVDEQKQKVSQLKDEEKKLTGATEDDQRKRENLRKELSKNETQLQSLINKQKDAKQAYEYEASGIGRLKRERELNEKAVNAEVAALKAEGKEQEANRVKRNGAQQSIENLNKTLDKQTWQLKRLKNNGATQEQIKQQEIYVSGTRKNLANARNEYKQLSGQSKQTFSSIESQAEKSNKRIREIIKGSAIGSLVASGARKVLSTISGAVGDAIDRVDTLNNSTKAYENMGIKAGIAKKANKELQKAIDGLPTSLQEATKNQQLLTSSMNNDVGKSTKVFKALNDGILGFGGSADQVNEAVTQLSQSFSNGKVDGQTWNSMINAQMGPTLNAIAKKMHMTTGELKSGLSTGKISVKEFQDQLVEMDKKGGGGLKSLSKIAKDSTDGVGTSMKNLRTKMVASLASVIEGLQKAGLSKYINKISKALGNSGGAFEKLGKIAGSVFPPVIQIIGNFVKIIMSVGKGVAQPFLDLAGAFGKVGGKNNLLNNTGKALGGIAKNESALKTLGTTITVLASGFATYKTAVMLATAKTKLFTTAQKINTVVAKVSAKETAGLSIAQKAYGTVMGVMTGKIKIATAAQKALNFVMTKNPIGLVITALTVLGVAFYELYKHNAKFKKFIDGIGKTIGQFFKSTGKTIDKGIKSMQKAFKGVMNFFKKDWKEILLFIVNPFSGAFALLYKHNSNFKKSIDKLINAIKKSFSGLTQWFKKLSKSVQKGFSSFGKTINNVWRVIWRPISKFVQNEANGWRKLINLIFKLLRGDFKGFGSGISKIWHNIWSGISKFFGNTFKSIMKITSNSMNWIKKKIADVCHAITKIWHNTWNGISKFFGGIWNGIKGTTGKGTKWVSDKISGFNKSVSDGWHNTWNGLSNFFSDIWNSIKAKAKDGMNGVIGIVNKGIDGINGMISSFGGDKTTIHRIPQFATGTANWRDVMGTNGAGAPPGLAMVNDGNGAEAIVYPDGRTVVPTGRNVVMPMMGGETVIPHEQAAKAGLVVPNAYKNGVGDIMGAIGKSLNSGAAWAGKAFNGGKSFIADILDDVKDMVKDFTGGLKSAWNFVQDPKKAFTNMVAPVTGGKGSFGSSITKMGKKQIDNFGGAWTGEVANAVKDIFSGGGSSSGGGKGDDYNPKWKAMGKDATADIWGYYVRECVSFVANRLNNLGVNPKLFSHLGNGSNWTTASVQHRSKPKPGDVAVYSGGSKYGNHVSIVTGVNGNKFNEEGYNAGNPPNGKYYKTNGLKFSDATTFLNFGAKARSSASEDSGDEKKSGLRGLVEKQAKKALDNLTSMFDDVSSKYADSGIQAVPGGGVMSKSEFAKTARKAAKVVHENLSKADIDQLYSQASFESTVNPNAVQGAIGDVNNRTGNLAKGLMQFVPGTFANYAMPGHKNIFSALDQLIATLNISGWRSFLAPTGVKRGWSPSGARRFANGGLISRPEFVMAGEEGPEFIIPTDIARKSRANQLLDQAYKSVNGKEPNTNNGMQAEEVGELVRGVNNLVGLMSSLLGVSKEQLMVMQSKNKNGNGDIFNAMANAQALNNYQSF